MGSASDNDRAARIPRRQAALLSFRAEPRSGGGEESPIDPVDGAQPSDVARRDRDHPGDGPRSPARAIRRRAPLGMTETDASQASIDQRPRPLRRTRRAPHARPHRRRFAGESGASVNRVVSANFGSASTLPVPGAPPCTMLSLIVGRCRGAVAHLIAGALRVAPHDVVAEHDLRARRDERAAAALHCARVRGIRRRRLVVDDRVVLDERRQSIAQRPDDPEPRAAEVLAAACCRR